MGTEMLGRGGSGGGWGPAEHTVGMEMLEWGGGSGGWGPAEHRVGTEMPGLGGGGDRGTELKLTGDRVSQETKGKTACTEGTAHAKALGHKVAPGRVGRGDGGR